MNRRSFFKLVGAAVVATQLPKLRAVLPPPLSPLASLMAALEAGNCEGLSGGEALQIEDVSAVMECVTFKEGFIDLRRPGRNFILDNVT